MVQSGENVERAFVAIPLSMPCRQRVAKCVAEIRSGVSGNAFRWVRPENFHVTLMYLGRIKSAQNESLRHSLREITIKVPAFQIECRGAGVFPSLGRPRVLWIGIHEPTGTLDELATVVREQGAECAGFREDVPFRPHLTVARIRGSRVNSLVGPVLEEAQAVGPIPCHVKAIQLLQSELGIRGSVYTELASFLLGQRQ